MLDIPEILIASIIPFGIDHPTRNVNNFWGAERIGFINPVTTFEAGPDKIDACYVGETKDEVILSFRGTVLPEQEVPWQLIKDWLNNLEHTPITNEGFPGKVHKGFLESVMNLASPTSLETSCEDPGFVAEIKARMATGKKSLIITGYSKGGALAPLAGILLKNNGIQKDKIKIVIFEAPRCGDRDFSSVFNQLFPNVIRYEYQDDLVPHFPFNEAFVNKFSRLIADRIEKKFKTQDYHPVGHLRFVAWDNNILEDSDDLEARRLDKLPKAKFELITDHLPCGIFQVLREDQGDCLWAWSFKEGWNSGG